MHEDTTLVNGEWRRLASRKDVVNPATGAIVGTICWGDTEQAIEAADAAEAAFGSWSRTSPKARADILLRASSLLVERSESIARILAAEAGKRLPEALGEVLFSAEYLRWFAEEARRTTGHMHTSEDPARRHMSVRSASGVVASLTSWNFPCSLQSRKIAPALAAGCTVVARVSERAPLAVTELVRALQDSGLPPGVLNIVHGPAREITGALLAHPAVRVVTFTGSTDVGRQIMAQASQRVMRPLLELGGDAPFIVFDDADIDAAVDAAVLAKTRNAGQSCVAANRFIVQDAVFDEFTTRFARRLDEMTIGDGLSDPMPDLGPLIDKDGVESVWMMVEDAIARGAREVTTPRDVPSVGSFLRPMLLVDVPDDARLAMEEVFGPVAAAFRFKDEAEAIARANRTDMGLAAFVFSSNNSRCWRVAEELQAGIVGINDPVPSVVFAPMGGVNQSGLGREGATVGLEEFTESKYLAWRV